MFFKIPETDKQFQCKSNKSRSFHSFYLLQLNSLTFSLLWLMVAVGLARSRRVFSITSHLLVSLLECLLLSFTNMVELILWVELHIHFGLHPQPLCPARILTVTRCGGLCWPVRLHMIGY